MVRPPLRRKSLGRSVVRFLLGCAGLLFAVSCTANSPPEVTDAPAVTAGPTESAALAAVLTFGVDEPVKTNVTIRPRGDRPGRRRTLTYADTVDPADGLPLAGLRAGRPHEIRIVVEDRDFNRVTLEDTLTYTPPEVPSDPALFPPIEITAADTARMEAGFTLLNARRTVPANASDQAFSTELGLLVALDRSGAPVWTYRTDSPISDFDVLSNGHILYLTRDYRAVEVDLLGNVIASWYAADRPQGPADGVPVQTSTFHHDVERLRSGTVLVLGSEQRTVEDYYTSEIDPDAPRADQTVMGDEILEFDPQTGEILWRWNAFDHLDPFRIGYDTFSPYWERRGFPETLDWSHADAVVPRPGQDAVVVSFRLQSAVAQIDRRTGRVEWILGAHGAWPPELDEELLEPQAQMRWPYHPHAPTITSRGSVLLFDNGNFRARPFEEPVPPAATRSRIVEYVVDREERTVHQVWSSEASDAEPVVSWTMGDVEMLPETGNVLAGYGYVLPPEHLNEIGWDSVERWPPWTLVREFTHSAEPEVVWEAQIGRDADLPVGWTLVGVERVAELHPFGSGPER